MTCKQVDENGVTVWSDITAGIAEPEKELVLDENGTVNFPAGTGITVQNKPVDTDIPTWRDNYLAYSRFPYGQVVLDDLLWGLSGLSTMPNPSDASPLTTTDRYSSQVLAFDGLGIGEGAVTCDAVIRLFSDGVDLYATGMGKLAVITTSNKTGTWGDGDKVTQAGSNAHGWYVRTDSDGKIHIKQASASAAFNSSGVITAASGGTATSSNAVVSSTADTNFLQRSTAAGGLAAGFAPWKIVMDFGATTTYSRSFVACGTQDSLRLNLFMPVQAQGTTASEIWYNNPTENNTWTSLFSTLAGAVDYAIRHFHGGIVIPGIGAGGNDRLLIMTGDGGEQYPLQGYDSILVCDDIADLIANPADWKTNWGLGLSGSYTGTTPAARKTALQTTYPQYNYGHDGGHLRCTDIIISPDQETAYYIPDFRDMKLHKINLTAAVADTVAEEVGVQVVPEPGCIGITTSNGTMLFNTFGDYTNLIHTYGIVPSIDDVKELDVQAVTGKALGDTLWVMITSAEYPASNANGGNTVWFQGIKDNAASIPLNAIVADVFPTGSVLHNSVAPMLPALYNLIQDGRFARTWTIEWDSAGQYTTNFDPYCEWGYASVATTGIKETTLVDVAGGNNISIKLDAAGGGAGTRNYLYVKLSPMQLAHCRGRYVTFRVRCLYPAAVTGTHHVNMTLRHNSTFGGSVATNGYFESIDAIAAASDSWQTLEFQTYIPVDTQYAELQLVCWWYGDTDATTNFYFSDCSIVPGALLGKVPANLPSFQAKDSISGNLICLNNLSTRRHGIFTDSAGMKVCIKTLSNGIDNTGILNIGWTATDLIGFYGKAATVGQQLFATGASHTVDELITVLQNIGLLKQS